MIPISKPSIEKSDLRFIKRVFKSKILTDGYFQQCSENLIKKLIKSNFVAITQSCTAALEISAILINLKKNDEVIIPHTDLFPYQMQFYLKVLSQFLQI